MTARRRERAVVPAVLAMIVIIAAFVLRGRWFGVPDFLVDDQFYLLVGDRILHDGAVPYVDIWDRKPPGLFLIYAAIRLLGGEGIIQYQIVATLFVTATALIIGWWVSRVAGKTAGLAAALFALVLHHRLGGMTGQAEVFMNLFNTAAAWMIARRLPPLSGATARPGMHLMRDGLTAMALTGLAMQIKQTAVIPGMFLGLCLIILAWRAGWRGWRLAGAAALWAGAALAPTLLAAGFYAVQGHLGDYIFANFRSVGLKTGDPLMVSLERFRVVAVRIGVPLAGALVLIAWHVRRRTGTDMGGPMLVFLLGWLASGFAAFVIVGAFYSYYALVMLPMASVLIGTVARPRGAGWLMLALMTVTAARLLVQEQAGLTAARRSAPGIYHMADVIRTHLHGGCLYVFQGPPILYHLTGSCLPTRFAFPNHLSLSYEQRAIGADPAAEVRRILATRPPVIVFHEVNGNENKATTALVRQTIGRDYRLIATAGPDTPERYRAYALKRAY